MFLSVYDGGARACAEVCHIRTQIVQVNFNYTIQFLRDQIFKLQSVRLTRLRALQLSVH